MLNSPPKFGICSIHERYRFGYRNRLLHVACLEFEINPNSSVHLQNNVLTIDRLEAHRLGVDPIGAGGQAGSVVLS